MPGDQFRKPAKAGDKPAPEAGDFQKEDAEKAKAALLDYIRANPEAFIGKPDPDKLTTCPLIARGDGCFSFGAFEVYVGKKAWSAWADRDGPEPYLYEGKFTVDQSGRWRAEPPKLSRFHR